MFINVLSCIIFLRMLQLTFLLIYYVIWLLVCNLLLFIVQKAGIPLHFGFRHVILGLSFCVQDRSNLWPQLTFLQFFGQVHYLLDFFLLWVGFLSLCEFLSLFICFYLCVFLGFQNFPYMLHPFVPSSTLDEILCSFLGLSRYTSSCFCFLH